MSEHKGYKGKIHDFLISNKIEVGDLVKVTSELTYSGILMPRYESGDENHIVLKLKSGYNIGCLLYTSPSPRDGLLSRMPSSA